MLLDSILIQDFNDYEVVITDDSSDNGVEDIAKEYSHKMYLKYFRNTLRLGSPENWNESIRLAEGEYIKPMHHDDWFADQGALRKFVAMLEVHPHADFAFCSTQNIDREGGEASIHSLTAHQLQMVRENPECLFYKKLGIGAPSVTIFRRSSNISFDKNLKWFVDIDFYIRLLSRNINFAYSDEPLVCVSDVAQNRVTRTIDSTIDLSERVYVFNKIRRNKLSDVKFVNSILDRLIGYDKEGFKKARNILRNNHLIFIYYLGILLRFRALSIRFGKRQLKSLLIYLKIWSYLQRIGNLVSNKRV